MKLHLGLEHTGICIHRGSSKRLEALGLDGALRLCLLLLLLLLLSSSELLEEKLLLEKLDLLGAHLRQLETLRDSTCEVGSLLQRILVLLKLLLRRKTSR